MAKDSCTFIYALTHMITIVYILYMLDVISDYDTCVCIYNVGNGILYMTTMSFRTIERVINIQDLSTSHEIGKNYLEMWTFYFLISTARLGVPNYIFGNKLSRLTYIMKYTIVD